MRIIKTQGGTIASRTALLYAVFAGAWIYFSDRLLAWLVADPILLTHIQTYKGWAFVAVTAPLLYFVLRSRLRGLEESQRARLAAEVQKQKLAERLQHCLAASPTITYALKVEGKAARPVWVSENIQGLLGYTPGEALQPGWWEKHLHPEDRERALANQSILFEKGSLAHEYRFFRKDGSVLWVRDELRLVDGEDGSGQEIVGAWTDITTLKKKEEEEQRAARSFRMISRCNEAIALAEEEGALMEKICRILVEERGYRLVWAGFAEEEPGRRVRPVAQTGFEAGYLEAITITWDEAETGRGPTGTAIRSGRPVVCRNMLTDPTYAPWREEAIRRGYASSIALPLTDEKGTFGALNIYASEADAFGPGEVELLRKLADNLSFGIKALRDRTAFKESEVRYHSLFQQATDGILSVDAQGRIRECNPSICAMLGYECEELLAKNLQELISPEDLAAKPLMIAQAAEGEPLFVERKLCRKDGAVVITEASVTKLESGLLLEIARDVTERKQREEEIRARNAELAALYGLSTHMRAAKRTAELLPIVLVEIHRLLGADGSRVTLLLPDRVLCTIALGEGLWKKSTGLTIPVEQCFCRPVVQTGKPYASEDYGAEARALPPGSKEEEIGPVAFVPLKSEEELLGVLGIARHRGADSRPFTPAEVRLLAAIGEMVGNVLRRLKLYEEAERRLRHTQALRSIDMAITGSLDLRVTFKVILDEITAQLGVDAAAILRLDPYTKTLKYEAWRGFRGKNLGHIALGLGEGFAGRAALERSSLYLPELGEAEQDAAQEQLLAGEGFAAYYAVPLIAKGHVQGVLEIFCRKPAVPDGEWLEFLETLAGQAAVAIDNAELFHDLERANVELIRAYDATIEGWAYALDLKDEETEGHSRRVTEMTLRIAREMGLKDEELVHVRRGALLHDIGKMGVPDAILLKPGKLTDEEWEIMRRHPVYAYQMLSRIGYLRPALDIPYCHHEKWDGTGYPRGLKGEEIPLPARIFAVVDVFDALTSDRPYRPAWPKEKALAYLRQQAGRHFDPRVVEAFLSLTEQNLLFEGDGTP